MKEIVGWILVFLLSIICVSELAEATEEVFWERLWKMGRPLFNAVVCLVTIAWILYTLIQI